MAETKQGFVELARGQMEFRVQSLTRETGVTEAQARELIDLIGNDANGCYARRDFSGRSSARTLCYGAGEECLAACGPGLIGRVKFLVVTVSCDPG